MVGGIYVKDCRLMKNNHELYSSYFCSFQKIYEDLNHQGTIPPTYHEQMLKKSLLGKHLELSLFETAHLLIQFSLPLLYLEEWV